MYSSYFRNLQISPEVDLDYWHVNVEKFTGRTLFHEKHTSNFERSREVNFWIFFSNSILTIKKPRNNTRQHVVGDSWIDMYPARKPPTVMVFTSHWRWNETEKAFLTDDFFLVCARSFICLGIICLGRKDEFIFILGKYVCIIYFNTYYIVYICIGLYYYIFDYMLDYILHYIYVVGRIRNTKEQNTKSQSSHHDTVSIITPRHYNCSVDFELSTQFNDNQALQIRR